VNVHCLPITVYENGSNQESRQKSMMISSIKHQNVHQQNATLNNNTDNKAQKHNISATNLTK